MHLLQAAVLGLIQGLTEFLPVSSSAHLILLRELFGWGLFEAARWNTIFDLSVHAGTLAALLAYFWPDVSRLLAAFFASLGHGIAGNPDRRLAWILLLGTIPAALAGALGQTAIEGTFRQAPMIVAVLLILFGLLLWAAERLGRKARDLQGVGWLDGLLTGLFQALSLAPGVSRSGITMTAGLARGLTRQAAARFSFLLSIPIIAGAALYALLSVAKSASALPAGSAPIFAIGFLSAGISGYLCIRYFLSYLQKRALTPFILYRVALGAFLVIWFALGR